ncbi:hypothetical protein G6F52_002595 [Rhizopus delemar]|nr:hypothetical protein G6F52_002595 [Rhizopus delemar]
MELEGRDKLIKTIQYFIKLLLHYQFKSARPYTPLVSQFSITRKILRLGNAIGPLREMKDADGKERMVLFVKVMNGVSDDVFCFYKLGLLTDPVGRRAERVAAYCWFISIAKEMEHAVNLLRQQSSKHKMTTLDEQDEWMIKVSIVKLFMDGIFCGCDLWRPAYSNGAQAWSGLFSGLLSLYKLWVKFSF